VPVSSLSSFLATVSALVFSMILTSKGPSLASRSLTISLKALASRASANLLFVDACNKTNTSNIDYDKKNQVSSSQIKTNAANQAYIQFSIENKFNPSELLLINVFATSTFQSYTNT